MREHGFKREDDDRAKLDFLQRVSFVIDGKCAGHLGEDMLEAFFCFPVEPESIPSLLNNDRIIVEKDIFA